MEKNEITLFEQWAHTLEEEKKKKKNKWEMSVVKVNVVKIDVVKENESRYFFFCLFVFYCVIITFPNSEKSIGVFKSI